MLFHFNVNLNDQDYLDYNIFWMLRSPYGKKQLIKFRMLLTLIFAVACFFVLFNGNFSQNSFWAIIPLLILFIVVQVLFNTFFIHALKGQLKSQKKTGKMGYSPSAKIEFHEETFVETTPNNKTEQKYTAVERISVIENKSIYIHVNTVMAYILPFSSFTSTAQYEEFLAFMKTKCENIDTY